MFCAKELTDWYVFVTQRNCYQVLYNYVTPNFCTYFLKKCWRRSARGCRCPLAWGSISTPTCHWDKAWQRPSLKSILFRFVSRGIYANPKAHRKPALLRDLLPPRILFDSTRSKLPKRRWLKNEWLPVIPCLVFSGDFWFWWKRKNHNGIELIGFMSIPRESNIVMGCDVCCLLSTDETVGPL